MGSECVWRFCPVSEGKAFLKLFFESLKKKKDTNPKLPTRAVLQASCEPRRTQEWSFVFRFFSLCFWHISASASHQAELVFRCFFFFPVIFAVVCADTEISAKTPLLPVKQCVRRRASSLLTVPFFFFLDRAHKIHHGCGMRDFLFFCTDIRLSWRRD